MFKYLCGCYTFLVWEVGLLLKVDEKGRITIPSEIRRKLGIKGYVKIQVAGDKLVIEPVRNPLERLMGLVVDSGGNIEEDIRVFRRKEEEKLKELVKG